MSVRPAVASLVLALFASAPASTSAADVTWAAAFPTRGAPPAVHFRASYTDAHGASHDLEVWRDRERRLRRKTDDALDLYVTRAASGEYAYRLVDHRHSALIAVSRTNLYRIGVFSDWAGLAHVVVAPTGAYRLVPLDGVETTPLGPCARTRIEREGGADEVCWSKALALPLRIRHEAGGVWATTFEVKTVARAVGPQAFRLDPTGLQVVDADADIDPSHEQ